MAILHVNVAKKVATYNKRDGIIVCGNSDYQIQFTFDAEWDAYEKKTARFIWRGQYHDVDFTGDTCAVPIITGTYLLEVGVYAGELSTTTSASIGCQKSILCHGGTPSTENDRHYANEAKEAADRAAYSAHLGEVSLRLARLEENLGLSDPFITLEAVGNGTTDIPAGVKGYAYIDKIYGRYCVTNRMNENYKAHECNPPRKIMLDNGKVIDLSGLKLAHFGDSEHDYIYFSGGKAYFHLGTRWIDNWHYMTAEEQEEALEEGETVLDTIYDEGALILLAEPEITDISDTLNFDGSIDTRGATTIAVESKYNSAEDDPLDVPEYEDYTVVVEYAVGGVALRFEKPEAYIDTEGTKLGDIDAALDSILAIQNALLGEQIEEAAVAGGDAV